VDLDDLLSILGSETRRKILILLTRRPYFVSELSQELGIGQKAVLEHLKILEGAGLIEGRVEKIPRGRPRKYYTIKKGFRLEILLTPYRFGTEFYEARGGRRGEEYLQARRIIKSTEPPRKKIKELAEFLEELESRIDEIAEMRKELEEVRLLTETYMENLLRRIEKENEEELRQILGELPEDIVKKLQPELKGTSQ